MHELLKNYAPVVVIALIFSALLYFMFSANIWATTPGGKQLTFLERVSSGAMKQMDDGDFYKSSDEISDNADVGMLNTRAERANPTVHNNGRIIEETSFLLVGNFTFTDCDGRVYTHPVTPSTTILWSGLPGGSVQVLGVYQGATDKGTDITNSVYNAASGIVNFPDPGVYTVKFKIKDRFNVETTLSCQQAIDMKPPPPPPPPPPEP